MNLRPGAFYEVTDKSKTAVKQLFRTKTNVRYYILAVMIVAVWGSTFSATKVLESSGVSTPGTFFFRFLGAWALLFALSFKKLWAKSLKDELLLALTGILGGTLYYWLQNTALTMSQTTNVSFLMSFCPLITIVLASLLFRDQKITRNILIGLAIALTGVGFVIFSGHHDLHLSPKGDALALLAAASWACYSLLLRPLAGKYPSLFISRKTFFYGWVTSALLFAKQGLTADALLLGSNIPILLNILYLTVFASVFCYWAWGRVISNLGPVRSASFLYLDPFFSTLFSILFMNEIMTWRLAVGLILIFTGVFIAQNKFFHGGNA